VGGGWGRVGIGLIKLLTILVFHRQTDRQIHKQTDRQTDIQTDIGLTLFAAMNDKHISMTQKYGAVRERNRTEKYHNYRIINKRTIHINDFSIIDIISNVVPQIPRMRCLYELHNDCYDFPGLQN